MKIPCCPHCGLLTLQGRVSGAKVFICEECKGHYDEGATLRDHLHSHADVRTFERLLQRARDAQPSTRELKCPDCQTASYHEVRSEGVLIDACATCGGLYLDKGEADIYLRVVRVHQPASKTVDRAIDLNRAADFTLDLFDLFY